MSKWARPSDIAEIAGVPPMHVGNRLNYMTKGKLVELVNKEKKLWLITDAGRLTVVELGPLSQT